MPVETVISSALALPSIRQTSSRVSFSITDRDRRGRTRSKEGIAGWKGLRRGNMVVFGFDFDRTFGLLSGGCLQVQIKPKLKGGI
jgi:hypothetical protein